MKRSARANDRLQLAAIDAPDRACPSRGEIRCAESPPGSFWRMVCSMTRGPANPISAFGSAMFMSPSIAKLAVTPPVVGSVSTDNVGEPHAVETRSAAADLRHLHQRQRPFHHAGAARAADDDDRPPPLDGRSIARVIFSPTTTPMLPPMNAYSMAATIVAIPSSTPEPTMTASFSPVAAAGLQTGVVRLRVGELRAGRSRRGPGRARSTRVVEQHREGGRWRRRGNDARIWGRRAGSRRDPCCRSTCAQPGHFTQSPSGTRLGLLRCASIGLRVFLNQAMAVSLPGSLLRARHVVARARAHRPDLPDEIVERLVAALESNCEVSTTSSGVDS